MGFQRRLAFRGWIAVCVLLALLAAASAHAAKAVQKKPAGRNKDLVVLEYERWVDTLRGTVKNFSKSAARDVTVVVKFLNRKKTVLGTQRVNVGDLRSGDQTAWSLAIEERNRPATSYQFEVHAIWR